jgi:hypothetical protein
MFAAAGRISLCFMELQGLAGPDPGPPQKEDEVDDSVLVDAKRILLRYGAPIGILDHIGETDRVELARLVSRTPVPDRGDRLLDLLVERGFLEAEVAQATAKGRKKGSRRRK